ncbi:MAG: formylglycine-generating enzyme family protein [Spirochaetales bacterium]|nr:formylglycine-generating enzyme family protein [Spirochaetales bacterium]
MNRKSVGLFILVLGICISSCQLAINTFQEQTVTLLSITGVPAPITGAIPVTILDSSQYSGTMAWSPLVSGTFSSYNVYSVQISLKPKPGFTLNGVAANSFKVQGASSTTNSANSGVVTAIFPETTDSTVSILEIHGVTPPVLGGAPSTKIYETDQYTGVIRWTPDVDVDFLNGIVYSAIITLEPKNGYTFTGIDENSFLVAGATSVTNCANSGVVTAVFPVTEDAMVTITWISGIFAPALGATPATTIAETSQYTGTVTWSPEVIGTFEASTEYSATIILESKNGYTFTGVAANSFCIARATCAQNNADSGIITVMFPPTLATPVADIVSENIGNLMLVEGGTYCNTRGEMTVSSFRISQYEITGAQYAAVMNVEDPSYYSSTPNNPVERVSWYATLVFCNKLSVLEGLTPVYSINGSTNPEDWGEIPQDADDVWNSVTANWNANGYRLPTEAEWMWAFFGGVHCLGYEYSGSDDIDSVAWYYYNADHTTHAVGSKVANELGLYDMSGNVYEMCWDWDGPLPTTHEINYRGPASGNARVIRGGFFGSGALECARYHRAASWLGGGSEVMGFRVARN